MFKNWLPWWSSGWESTCQCRGYRFDLWSWNISQATEQPSPCATTTKHTSSRGHAREAPTKRNRSTATRGQPRMPQLDKAHAQQQRPKAAKNKYKKKKKKFFLNSLRQILCCVIKKKGYKEIFGDDNCFFNLRWRVQVYIYAYAQTHQIVYLHTLNTWIFFRNQLHLDEGKKWTKQLTS